MWSDTLYPFAIITLLLSVVWWFYRANRDQGTGTWLPTLSFWAATVAYALVIYFTQFSFYYKLLLMLPRDLVTIVVVGVLANNLKTSRAFFLMAVGLGFGGYVLYSNMIGDKIAQYFVQDAPRQVLLDDQGELLIDIHTPAQLAALETLLRQHGAQLKPAFANIARPQDTDLDEYYLVDVPNDSHVADMVKLLHQSGLVDDVEQNEMVALSPPLPAPKSSRKPIDYGLNDPQTPQQWGLEITETAAAAKLITQEGIKPRKRIKIAILDTGVDAAHEDLNDNYTSTRKRYDYDKQSHGTHCAGIAGAVSNNRIGIASLNLSGEYTQITSIKVLNDRGLGTQATIINGIIEAADTGAGVISLSLGGYSTDEAQRAYNAAIAYAQQAGAIVVVAAGNEDTDARNVVPASCEGVIVVSAIQPDLQKASFSNYVSHLKMALAAPGVEILSTVPKNQYAAYSGTSMATPFVAGLIGLMKSLRPDLSAEQAYQILSRTGKDTRNTPQTGKLVDVAASIKAVVQK